MFSRSFSLPPPTLAQIPVLESESSLLPKEDYSLVSGYSRKINSKVDRSMPNMRKGKGETISGFSPIHAHLANLLIVDYY